MTRNAREQYLERLPKILDASRDTEYLSEATRKRARDHAAAFEKATSWFFSQSLNPEWWNLWLRDFPHELLKPLIADCDDEFYAQLERELQAVDDVYATYTSLRKRLVVIMNTAWHAYPGLEAKLRQLVEEADPQERDYHAYECNVGQQVIDFTGSPDEVLEWMDNVWSCLAHAQAHLSEDSHLSFLIGAALKL
jgi:hypothetical protein